MKRETNEWRVVESVDLSKVIRYEFLLVQLTCGGYGAKIAFPRESKVNYNVLAVKTEH